MRSFSIMDGESSQPRQQSSRAGGGKGKAKIKVKLCKSALLPFKKALLYARSLKLKTVKEWEAWRMTGERPASIPSTPHLVYKHDGWQGWGHWLGTDTVSTKDQQFLPFKKALLHARSLKLKSFKEWQAWCKSDARPANIPSNPNSVYTHDAWQGYGHWLGTGTVASKDQKFLPFKTALLCARSLKLKSNEEWLAWCKSGIRPANIPATPERVYKNDGWQGYGHWLGTGKLRTKEFLPFKKALLYARSLKLKSKTEWNDWAPTNARPANIPSHPDGIYKHVGWQGYGHWLGTGNVGVKKDQQFLPFKKALLYARSLKLTSEKEWREWRRSGARPANMPSCPEKVYKHQGWQGYRHWLGTADVH